MKVTFLFGSGADTDASDKLKSGQSFAEAFLQNRYSHQIKSITGFDASHFQLIYPRSKKVFIQTILAQREKAQKLFGTEIVDDIVCYSYEKSSDHLSKKIANHCSSWYDTLKHPNAKSIEIKNFFLQNAVLFDSLDEKFNSLRDTNYNSNAKRVINAYLTVFLLMFESLYDIPLDFEWNYPSIFEKLKEPYDIAFSNGCYYNILANSGIDCNIITTNYTDIVNTLAGRDENDIVYLHGKMTLFEDLKSLSVFDCKPLQNTNIQLSHDNQFSNIIPFILIPSGVKPIICQRQIQEFAKFIHALDQSEYLIVLGYRFNSEDNHINSIIAEWLRRRQRKLPYLNYNASVDFSTFNWADEFSVGPCEKPADEVLRSNSQIINIKISKENARSTFEELLSKLR